ncbi:MAG TPA: PIN domain-containing protein [Chromatiales bacterium]|nr:PIN domain-containing protein [Chromatiales bacterium]
MPCVLDASAALALVLPDEAGTAAAVERHLGRTRVLVPAIWHLEVGNALLVAVRRGRMRAEEAQEALDLLASLPIEAAELSPWESLREAWSLALGHGLTVYDAAYLALAGERRLPLLTLDRRLAGAARALGIEVIPES